MRKRSVTLVETLMALVLLLAIGALVLPSLLENLDERTFESAADVTSEQLMLARAHAQSTGKPVEVMYDAGKSQVQARLFAPWLMPMGAGEAERGDGAPEAMPSGRSRTPGALRGAGAQDESAFSIAESWACRTLASGLRMLASPPLSAHESSADSRDDADRFEEEGQSIADLAKGQEIRLAVFMPDGSALAGDPVWLNDADGRRGVFIINPWNGLPMFRRLDNRSDSSSPPGESLNDDDVGGWSAEEEGKRSAAAEQTPRRGSAGSTRQAPARTRGGDGDGDE